MILRFFLKLLCPNYWHRFTKGKDLKIGSDVRLALKIESMIKEEKKSLEVVAYELKEEKLIDIIGTTITFDNGVEFMDYKRIEQSCLKKGKRIAVYYAHPYCSGERDSNENNNRMIRRWMIIDNNRELVK